MLPYTQYISGGKSGTPLDGISRGCDENAVDVARQLWRAMSWFETDLADFDPGTLPAALRSLIAVYRNFLQRGTPSHASTFVEDHLAVKWGRIGRVYDDTGGFTYVWRDTLPEHLGYQLYMSLFLVDPRVDDRVHSLRVWEGFTGTKMGRKTWERIRGLGEGETWVHTVDPARSELYGGKTISYRAPFDKCDRVEDYRRAWAFFSQTLETA